MENDFLLIDEPTNHLDMHARECVKEYLCGKKGFILVSHDRDILDACIDHVLVLNRKTIEVQSRVTQYERRMEREIQEKEGLLQDIEQPVSLKLMPLSYHKERLISCRELSVRYEGAESDTLKNLTFELMHGERVFLHGENGCGKSTLIKTILQQSGSRYEKLFVTDGEIRTASNLVVSHINQDTSFLQGDIRAFCRERNLEESLFFTLLRQLDMERAQFAKRLEEFSEGQKKKVLIAASLMTPAHVYIWDEPLNYIDVFSRMQIEQLILRYQPTMILVDHDIRFQEKIATRVVEL